VAPTDARLGPVVNLRRAGSEKRAPAERGLWLGCLMMALLAAACGAPDERPVPPYIPSPQSLVVDMLALAAVNADDFLIDLGSGDGRIVITAAREFGARGLGVDIDPALVAWANAAAQAEQLDGRVRFIEADLFETDLSEATVVTLYLLPETVNRLAAKLLRELRPGARVVSHDYPIEGWELAGFLERNHEEKIPITGVARTNLYLYRIPVPP
jgi:SAM-dependent methyltransferase